MVLTDIGALDDIDQWDLDLASLTRTLSEQVQAPDRDETGAEDEQPYVLSDSACTSKEEDVVNFTLPFISLLLNGQMAVQVNLPADVEHDTRVTFDIPDSVCIESNASSLHLCTTVIAPCTLLGQFKFTLTLQGSMASTDVQLGLLTPHCLTRSCRDFIPYRPVQGTLLIQLMSAAKTLASSKSRQLCPEEDRFLESIVAVLKSPSLNPGGGSLSTAVLFNHAKAQPYFEAVIVKRHNNNLLHFLKAHPGTLRHFQFTAAEIEKHKLAPFVRPSESRVALVETNWLALDARRAAEFVTHNEALLRDLMQYFRTRGEPVSQRELLTTLSKAPCFLHLSQPSLGVLQKFLTTHGFVCSDAPDMRGTVSSVGRSGGSSAAPSDD